MLPEIKNQKGSTSDPLRHECENHEVCGGWVYYKPKDRKHGMRKFCNACYKRKSRGLPYGPLSWSRLKGDHNVRYTDQDIADEFMACALGIDFKRLMLDDRLWAKTLGAVVDADSEDDVAYNKAMIDCMVLAARLAKRRGFSDEAEGDLRRIIKRDDISKARSYITQEIYMKRNRKIAKKRKSKAIRKNKGYKLCCPSKLPRINMVTGKAGVQNNWHDILELGQQIELGRQK